MNKEFVDVFKQANADVRDNIKELDDIKHSGTLEYNYAKSIYPTYLADELSIISDVLEKSMLILPRLMKGHILFQTMEQVDLLF